MYFIGFLILLGVAYFYFSGKKKSSYSQNSSVKTKSQSAGNGATSFDSPIPRDYQIFAKNIQVAGIQYRKAEAIKFAKDTGQELVLEKEVGNEHDPNPIKLIGVSGANNYFIGYLPKDLSNQIAKTGLYDVVKVRLLRIFQGKNDFIDIDYQIVGPKIDKKKFDAFLLNQPLDTNQKEYFKFFNLPISKGMTFGEADQIIGQHKKNSPEEENKEWNKYNGIFEEFDDKEFREGYGLGKVSRAVLLEAINHFKAQGKSYRYMFDNIDEIVEKIIEMKPDLEKKA